MNTQQLTRRNMILGACGLILPGCLSKRDRESLEAGDPSKPAMPNAATREMTPAPASEDLWQRIHTWLRANAPKILNSLNPPATEVQVRLAERAFGSGMPRDWWDMYAVHDGMHDRDNLGSLFHGMHFLTLDESVREHALSINDGADDIPVRAADPGIDKRDMHNPKWVPFARSGDTLILLDLSPVAGGAVGQVIFTDYADDTVILLAGSVREFLAGFVADLEARRYFLNEDARREGNEFLDCVSEIDVVNWHKSPRWKHFAR